MSLKHYVSEESRDDFISGSSCLIFRYTSQMFIYIRVFDLIPQCCRLSMTCDGDSFPARLPHYNTRGFYLDKRLNY